MIAIGLGVVAFILVSEQWRSVREREKIGSAFMAGVRSPRFVLPDDWRERPLDLPLDLGCGCP